MNSTIRTLSYEDHGNEGGDFQFEDSLTQSSDGAHTAKLDRVDEREECIWQSSPTKDNMLQRSTKLVSSSMHFFEAFFEQSELEVRTCK